MVVLIIESVIQLVNLVLFLGVCGVKCQRLLLFTAFIKYNVICCCCSWLFCLVWMSCA